MDTIKLIRFPEVSKIAGGASRSTIRRWELAGKFPKRIKVMGPQSMSLWEESMVLAWSRNEWKPEKSLQE